MTEEDKIKVKAAIEEKIASLRSEIEDLKEMTKPLGLDNAIGRVSRMDYINNKSVNEAQLRQNESKLKALHNWLSKLGSSDFGKCSRCGKEININRLLYMPESTKCVQCAARR